MEDELNLKQHIRTVKDFPIKGIQFRDITSLVETPEAFSTACRSLSQKTNEFKASYTVGIESRGFVFAGSVACDLSLPLVLARKPGKLPNQTYIKQFDLEYGSTSIEIQKNTSIEKHSKVVIIDDLVATGGTAIACAELLTQNFNVKNTDILILSVIDLPELGGSKLIVERGYCFDALVSFLAEVFSTKPITDLVTQPALAPANLFKM